MKGLQVGMNLLPVRFTHLTIVPLLSQTLRASAFQM